MEVPIAGSDSALRLKAVGMRLANFIPSFSVAATCCTRGCVAKLAGISVFVGAFGDMFILPVQTPVEVPGAVWISPVHLITTDHPQV